MRDGMTKYGRSPWLDTFPKSRVPSYPRHKGVTQAPVVIIGGGLTGCATAYAFATSGVPVMLLEATRIGQGSTGLAGGWMGGTPAPSFVDVEKASGRAAARDAFRSWRRSALDFTALLRRLEIKSALALQSTAVVAVSPDQAARLKREQKARRDAGLEAPILNARTVQSELGLEAAAAIRDDAGAVLDPYRACLGLAAAAAARGAKIFEASAVRRITFDRRHADLATATGSIRTPRVIVATGIPGDLFKSLRRHFWFLTTYMAVTARVPAKIRQQLGRRTAVLRDLAAPPHVVRWVDDERLLVGGADSQPPPERQRDRAIVQRTGQLMYELSTLYPDLSGIPPEYGWEIPYARTSDGLPYIGPHRNFPHHLFAFGDSSHTVTGAYLASRVLLRHHLDELDPADRHFGFKRHGG
jgi:glycine/D-amino acid oxidase-like deaminating enzyme